MFSFFKFAPTRRLGYEGAVDHDGLLLVLHASPVRVGYRSPLGWLVRMPVVTGRHCGGRPYLGVITRITSWSSRAVEDTGWLGAGGPVGGEDVIRVAVARS